MIDRLEPGCNLTAERRRSGVAIMLSATTAIESDASRGESSFPAAAGPITTNANSPRLPEQQRDLGRGRARHTEQPRNEIEHRGLAAHQQHHSEQRSSEIAAE